MRIFEVEIPVRTFQTIFRTDEMEIIQKWCDDHNKTIVSFLQEGMQSVIKNLKIKKEPC